MKIFIGADHRGFELKNQIVEWLDSQGYEVIDCGNTVYEAEDDFPDFAGRATLKLKKELEDGSQAFGIVICGSGVGVSIVANRVRGIYCALGFDPEQVRDVRQHDHINMLSIPSNYVSYDKALEMIQAMVHSEPIHKEKYLRRLKKIDTMEV